MAKGWKRESARHALASKGIITTQRKVVRKTLNRKPWRCPRCGKMTTDYPALSRKDNKTEICSKCGTEEALSDYFKTEVKLPKPKTKPKEAYPLLTKQDYYKIATQEDLGYAHRDAYVKFMSIRFPQERDKLYAHEWAERFKKGIHWASADEKSKKVLKKVYGVK